MSHLRILVEVDGVAAVDRVVQDAAVLIDTHNDVDDTGRGDIYRDFRPTGRKSVLVVYTDREQELEFFGVPAKKGKKARR